MDNLENTLYSLLPLVLIIVFSWLFGLLGSRLKQKAEPAGNSTERREQAGDLFNIFGDRSGEQPGTTRMENLPPLPSDTTAWVPQRKLTPPPVTADPIKPKMWGA